MKKKRMVVFGAGLVVLFGIVSLATYVVASLSNKQALSLADMQIQPKLPPTIRSNPATPSISPSPQISQTAVLGASTQIATGEFATKLFNLINAYRQEAKLSPLRPQPLLNQSAYLKLQDMIAQQYWRHEDPNNVMSWYFFDQVGYPYESAGENLAFGASSPWQVFTDWQNSPTHNEQLLNEKYEEMGLAIDCETYAAQSTDGGCLVVLHLGKQKP